MFLGGTVQVIFPVPVSHSITSVSYAFAPTTQAARAWEAALVALLSDPEGKVARLAAEGNLTLSFSTER